MNRMQPSQETRIELPEPDSASAEHSRRVVEHIVAAIDASGGAISFAEFMQQALYAPGLGYYVAGTTKFGPDGDFVTAPETSELFGKVLARQCESVFKQIQGGDLFELGGGTGALAEVLLRSMAARGVLPDRYYILEVSPELRKRQEDRLRASLPKLIDRIEWLSEMPEDFRGVIVANEVADALPVERFEKTDNEVLQLGVAVEAGRFVWSRMPAPEDLLTMVQHIESDLGEPLPNGYVSEASLALRHWIGDLSDCLQEGFMFLFDYGVTRREYYVREKNEGWLRCHFRHRAHNDPLILAGIQDLTAWVDFSLLSQAAQGANLQVAGYVAQAQFLLGGGLADELRDFTTRSVTAQLELSREVKLLTLPTEMGENFKCLGLSRGELELPSGFSISDRAHML